MCLLQPVSWPTQNLYIFLGQQRIMVQCGLPNVLDWQTHVNVTEILEATWTPLFFIRSCFSLLFLQTLFGTTLLYSLLRSIMYASVLVLFHKLRLFLQIMSSGSLYC